MTEKDDLIPIAQVIKESGDEKPRCSSDGKEEPKDEEAGEKPTSSSSISVTASASSSTTVCSSSAVPKSEEKEDEPPSGVPSLYQKFVTSFDAVLQKMVSEDEPVRQKLPSLDIEGIANYIKEDMPRNVVFMVGAGISTSAGIPDFRTPGSGLYDNLTRFNLPDPQAIFDVSFFKRNPEPFYVLARDLFNERFKPTPCHYFIRLMEEKGLLRRCYTQNIDTLEYTAGIKEEKIITAHGSHQSSSCIKASCKKKYNKEWFMNHLKDTENIVARCEACKSLVKPDIVFFGEKLPNRFFSHALTDFPKCDLLIIMGTSLVVQPFASMVQQVPKDTPRLLINLTAVGQEQYAYGTNNALNYGDEGNSRDVFYQATCDDGAMKLARLLGWEDELKSLIEKSK